MQLPLENICIIIKFVPNIINLYLTNRQNHDIRLDFLPVDHLHLVQQEQRL